MDPREHLTSRFVCSRIRRTYYGSIRLIYATIFPTGDSRRSRYTPRDKGLAVIADFNRKVVAGGLLRSVEAVETVGIRAMSLKICCLRCGKLTQMVGGACPVGRFPHLLYSREEQTY